MTLVTGMLGGVQQSQNSERPSAISTTRPRRPTRPPLPRSLRGGAAAEASPSERGALRWPIGPPGNLRPRSRRRSQASTAGLPYSHLSKENRHGSNQQG